MLTCTEVTAAAPAWVGERLRGPVRSARVVHAGADAIYVDDGECLGVLSGFAVAVPCGMQTTLPTLPRIARDSDVAVGADRLRVGSLDIRIGRTVDAAAPRIVVSAERVRAMVSVAGSRLDSVRAELPAGALDALRVADATAVASLLGRGSGLTPVGDDVLCGWLATTRAAGCDVDPVASTVLELCAEATTQLSSTLLRRAVAGDTIPAFRRLLLHLHDGSDDATMRTTVDKLLATGHTSGAGMLLGSALGLDQAQRRSR